MDVIGIINTAFSVQASEVCQETEHKESIITNQNLGSNVFLIRVIVSILLFHLCQNTSLQ